MPVFVHRAAEDVGALDWGVGRDDCGWVAVGWTVLAALMWAVVVLVSGELVQVREANQHEPR